MIAFLGTGLLGSGFIKALLQKGEKVQVWNRTFEKAKELEADGAVAFEQAADAVKGVQRIHLCVSDDAVVDSVLQQAEAGMEKGAIIIDHSTTSKDGAVERTRNWAAKGYTYVHAPVFMGPSNALDSSGFMLISEGRELTEKLRPWLEPMTGKLLDFGVAAGGDGDAGSGGAADVTGKAAGIKLIGNLFLISLTGAFSDMLVIGKEMGIGGEEIATLFKDFNPGAGAPGRLKRIMARDYDNPSWELQMARKDARLMMEEAEKGGKSLLVIPPMIAEMDKFLEKGLAHKDWSVMVSDKF
ncbi:NAD(P)-dependent oxidoreductase [Flavihumibacter sp.]|uniref:NAD(P)-dependent oxidoreductase n=1 Tax=Flavihumibacter sp. TaxID=1913981 RepID=UPI002FCB48CA|nr:NAD(P)-binding domain-containing protein [Flavihumibacter sediminis]